jgi:hypothetical protein
VVTAEYDPFFSEVGDLQGSRPVKWCRRRPLHPSCS